MLMKLLQRLIPKYGNWGGPGWSGGEYQDDRSKTKWEVFAIDSMDFQFKQHDKRYQNGESWLMADMFLISNISAIKPKSFYGRIYRIGAIVVFSFHICYLAIFGDKTLY